MQPYKHTSKHVRLVSICTHFLQIRPDLFYRCKGPLAFLSQFASDALNQVDTLAGVITILFETVVVAVTAFHTLAILRLQKGINFLNSQSLAGALIQQGMHISLVVGQLLKAKKVWSDMGNSHLLPIFPPAEHCLDLYLQSPSRTLSHSRYSHL